MQNTGIHAEFELVLVLNVSEFFLIKNYFVFL
jgi:hypothetical protein